VRVPTGSPRVAFRLLGLAASAVVIALVAGCVAGRDAAPRTAPQAASADVTTQAPSMEAAAPTTPEKLTPGALALQLESLLGQHTVLASDMMRGRLRNDPDLAQAANAALGKNTSAMGSLIAGAFGQAAADKFTPLWSNHVTALFNYSRGLAENDQAVMANAKLAISRFEKSLAEFFSAASQGRLPREAATSAVDTHIQHLLGQADLYARKQYAASDKEYRQGYAHGYALGKALASTLLPPAQAKTLDQPLWRLTSALEQLLGEHVVLVVATMRAGVTDAPDFGAAAASVNANTTDLAGAIGVLFGQPAARSFQGMWADHIDLLVRYAASIAKGDDSARASASNEMGGFESRLSDFLNTATGNKLAAATLAKALQSHDTMLRQQVEAFVAKDYKRSHDLAYSTYQEMYGLAGQLAKAFGVTVAQRLPVGPAQTGRLPDGVGGS
jgi:hypothetical protein